MEFGIKRVLRRVLVARPAGALFRPFVAGRATVFMLHRFSVPSRGVHGDDLGYLAEVLTALRNEKYNFLGLQELVARLEQGKSVDRCVAFTIDDGYWEQGMAAGPVFAAHGCPVTVFLCTGFVDGTQWFWWDRIEFIFQNAKKSMIVVTTDALQAHLDLRSHAEAERNRVDFTLRLVRLSESNRLACIEALEQASEVAVPSHPSIRYAPLTWDEVRECERRGMSFAPHTISHPILSSTGDEQSMREISASWKRLNEEVTDPVPVFCYPNGGLGDFGPREVATIKKIGLRAAMAGVPGYVGPDDFKPETDDRYRLRRFALPSQLDGVMQCVTGVEAFKSRLRRG
jgi:peptidoglycan/xylan/chitin deacetylase (PgdA/CDA1 family)